MGFSLLIGGIVMWVVDWLFGTPHSGSRHRTESMEEMSVIQAVWIGICQIASAVFPGTSRSMATIAAGQVAGMSRPAALEFSFFLSIPTMVAATGYDLLRTLHPKHGGEPLGRMPANGHEWVVLLIGFVLSFFVALGVVAWFMNWVRLRGFTPFAIYRIIVGAAVLVWAVRGI
jgi:undecaprenyl-diphosphatase